MQIAAFVYTSCASHGGLELQQIPNICCCLIGYIGGGFNDEEAERIRGD